MTSGLHSQHACPEWKALKQCGVPALGSHNGHGRDGETKAQNRKVNNQDTPTPSLRLFTAQLHLYD